MLKKYMCDPSLVVPINSVRILDFLSYKEVLIEILDREFHHSRTMDMALVKVL